MSEEIVQPMPLQLEHRGLVFDDSEPERIPNQPNAQDVVAVAMDRSLLGWGLIKWFPDPREAVYPDTIERFETRIWEGVTAIVHGYSLENEWYEVEVKFVSGRCFEVFIARMDLMKGVA